MKRGPFIAGAGLLGVIALVPALVPSAVAADEQYGATVPYTRYEAEEASRSDGATLERSDDLESTAIEASGQSYVALNEQGCLPGLRRDDRSQRPRPALHPARSHLRSC